MAYLNCTVNNLPYFQYTPLQALHWTQLLFSVASIVVVIYTIAFHLRKSWFEGVFKETLYTWYFFILWHSFFTVLLEIIQIVSFLTANDACEMMIDKKYCVLRIVITLSFPSFVFLHGAVTLQRVITTFTGNGKLHSFVARCCLVGTGVYCVLYIIYGFRGYDLQGKTSFCSGYVKGAEELLLIGTFRMMMADVLNVAIDLLLIIYNRMKIGNMSDATLDVKFRHRQTLQSIQQMLPCGFFHLLCFTAQYVGFKISLFMPLSDVERETLSGFLYMMPYYCFIGPAIMLLLMVHYERRKKKELRSISTTSSEDNATGYFSALQAEWEKNRQTEKHTTVYESNES